MLGYRTFLTVLRQTPLRTTGAKATSRAVTHASSFARSSRPQQRGLFSQPTSRTLRPSPLSAYRTSLLRRIRNRRHNSNQSPASAQEQASQEAQSLSGRFRQLSRRYGWAAVGVYGALSVIDFPFCFLAVRLIGPDRIAEAEHAVVDGFWTVVALVMPSMQPGNRPTVEGMEAKAREAGGVELELHKAKENASTYLKSICTSQCELTYRLRHLDTTIACIWRPQVLDILPRAAHRSGDAKGGEDAPRLGLECRQS